MPSPSLNIAKKIPESISDTEVLQLLKNEKVDHRYIALFKEVSDISDEVISSWFNINVKTFRNYKKDSGDIKENIKEHLILLVSLFKHGKEVFGSKNLFSDWLHRENFFFDNEAPIDYLKTITGIRYIEDRLTAMEHGDNA